MAAHTGTKFQCLVPPSMVLRRKADAKYAAGDVIDRGRTTRNMAYHRETIKFKDGANLMQEHSFNVPTGVPFVVSNKSDKDYNGVLGFWRNPVKKGAVGALVVECDQVSAPKATGQGGVGVDQDFKAGDIVTFVGGVFVKTSTNLDPYREYMTSAVVYEDAGKDDDRCVVVMRLGRL